MKNKGVLALALVGLLTASALTPSVLAAAPAQEGDGVTAVEDARKGHRHGKHGGETVTEPENAIGKNAAKAKALADAGVTEEQAGKVRARVSQLEDGTVVYKVRFVCDGQRWSYQIDATTGAVTDKSVKAETEDDAAERRGHGRRGKDGGGKSADAVTEAAQTSV